MPESREEPHGSNLAGKGGIAMKTLRTIFSIIFSPMDYGNESDIERYARANSS